MNPFKYRGKRVSNGEWVYGGFHKHQKITPCPVIFDGPPPPETEYDYLIIQSGFSDWNLPKPVIAVTVDPETIGISWGWKDDNGTEIFTGDNVKVEIFDFNTGKLLVSRVVTVEFQEHKLGFYWGEPYPDFTSFCEFSSGTKFTVVGNVWDDEQ